jgi:L-threonylcarbamoyladenylate synthase
MEKIINEVENAFSVLKSGGIILYPTDTIWGIGCDATNDDAINKINSLKNRDNLTPMLSLINSSDMLNEFLHNKPNNIDEILKAQLQ